MYSSHDNKYNKASGRVKAKNVARTLGAYTLTGLLAAGVIIAFGLLSASGMMLVFTGAFFIVSAFIFGGVVEGEVFNQQIFAEKAIIRFALTAAAD